MLVRTIRRVRRTNPGRSRVSYYPRFTTTSDLANHYYRARWYLPHLEGRCDVVSLFVHPDAPTDAGTRPEYMCSDTRDDSHIEIENAGPIGCFVAAMTSDVVLAWTSGGNRFPLLLLRLIGVRVIKVDTEDLSTTEYGLYCSLIWKWLLTEQERQRILSENESRFKYRAARIFGKGYERACVFGTGPSLEKADQFDFGETLCIACNTIVENDDLLRSIKPEFIAAADVVSHLGVSCQSQDFRKSLVRALGGSDFQFVTTASFGYLLTLNYPDLKDRTILIDQTCEGPNHSLFERFEVPLLDSILNMLMLPLAATFCNEIWLLGCDGHSPERNENDNWDFWSHADGAGYKPELIASGHRCHPTFDPHRKKGTFDRYNSSIMATLETGETQFQIVYHTLFKSYTPGLVERSLPSDRLSEMRISDGRMKLSDLAARRLEKSQTDDGGRQDNELSTLLDITDCSVLDGNRLHLAGWAISPAPIDVIRLTLEGRVIATTPRRVRRPDVLREHPSYSEGQSGFRLECFITESATNSKSEIEVEVVSRGKIIGRKKIQLPSSTK